MNMKHRKLRLDAVSGGRGGDKHQPDEEAEQANCFLTYNRCIDSCSIQDIVQAYWVLEAVTSVQIVCHEFKSPGS